MQSNLCAICANYKGDFKCEAFKERIPDGIFRGLETHDKPTPGQENNIVFSENNAL